MDIIISSAQALWQVVAVGLLLGAGLPALFALGLRLWYGSHPAGDAIARPRPIATVGAIACFGLVGLAALFGIVVIVFGDQLFG